MGHPNSNLTTYTLPAASTVVDTFAYNKANYLTSISDKKGTTAFFSAAYNRDSAAWLTSDTSAPTNQTTYKYTSLEQLCYAGSANSTACSSPPAGADAFAYDAADNLTKLNTTSTTQQFNAADELCWTVTGISSNACGTAPTGATSYAYDTSGNRTSKRPPTGSATCDAYDQANRLVSIKTGTGSSCTSPTTVGTYSYNAAGLRMSKAAGGVTTSATWDPSGSLPLLLEDKTSASTLDYVYGPGGQVLEQVSSAATLWYHHDQGGSTRALTDAAGTVQDTYQFDAYGNTVATTGSAANPFLFTGQYRDPETSLYYLRARYYDPTTGQFISRDPVVPLTRSPYAYVRGNPLNSTDAAGLDCSWNPLDWGSCAGDAVHWAVNNSGPIANVAGAVQLAADVSLAVPVVGEFVAPVALPVSELSGFVATGATCVYDIHANNGSPDCYDSIQLEILSFGLVSKPALNVGLDIYGWLLQQLTQPATTATTASTRSRLC